MLTKSCVDTVFEVNSQLELNERYTRNYHYLFLAVSLLQCFELSFFLLDFITSNYNLNSFVLHFSHFETVYIKEPGTKLTINMKSCVFIDRTKTFSQEFFRQKFNDNTVI